MGRREDEFAVLTGSQVRPEPRSEERRVAPSHIIRTRQERLFLRQAGWSLRGSSPGEIPNGQTEPLAKDNLFIGATFLYVILSKIKELDRTVREH